MQASQGVDRQKVELEILSGSNSINYEDKKASLNRHSTYEEMQPESKVNLQSDSASKQTVKSVANLPWQETKPKNTGHDAGTEQLLRQGIDDNPQITGVNSLRNNNDDNAQSAVEYKQFRGEFH